MDRTDVFILLPYLGGVGLVLLNRPTFPNFTAIQFSAIMFSYLIMGVLRIIDFIFKLKIGQGVKFHGTR